MNLDFGQFDLFVDGKKQHGVPFWFSNLAQFAYQICSERNPSGSISEHYVLSLPNVDGGLAAISLGSIAAEIERIENSSFFEEISIDQLEVGMRVSLESGNAGQQIITGEVKALNLSDRTPKVEIGTKWIAVKFIRKISLIPSEAGNPQIFERKRDDMEQSPNLLSHLASSSLPIHRAVLDIRSTSKIIEDEFEWAFLNHANSISMKIKDLIRPIGSGKSGSGWSIVLNSSESEELAWSNLNSELSASELEADISVLCSSASILAQIESTNSKIVFSIHGRDDRQLPATELAIKQKYEYSSPLGRDISSITLLPGIELITFEVDLNA